MNANKKVVLITGSSRGIGYAAARALHERGHIVYATMRAPGGRNAPAARELEALGDSIHVLELEVRDATSVERAVSEIVRREGRLDVVVNNAGIMNLGLAEGFTVEQLDEQMNVNYLGPARLFRGAVPVMREQGEGLFITVSSLAGRVVFPFLSTYNPSKFAIEALAEIYRYELSRFAIDSVVVQPGPFETGLIDAAPRPADQARLEAYGELAGAAEQAMAGFKTMMAGSPHHDPVRLPAPPYRERAGLRCRPHQRGGAGSPARTPRRDGPVRPRP
jgi:NAD(P)-dependent dehydrogenase (short-subunit alcohol dehydrogenase family)